MSFLNIFIMVALLISIFVFLKSNWPGWICFPIAILLLRLLVDVGISPMIKEMFGIKYEITDATIVKPIVTAQILPASTMILCGYLSVLVGLVVVRCLFNKRPTDLDLQVDISEKKINRILFANRAYRASLILFLFGLLCIFICISSAKTGLSLSEIASTRAVFTNENAYGSFLFNYAWLLKSNMQIGAWGMLLFSSPKTYARKFSWMANLCYILVLPIFGGRTTALLSVIGLALVYHYGIKKLSFRQIVVASLAGVLVLSSISIIRFGVKSPGNAVVGSVFSVFTNRVLEEAAFGLEEFPGKISFLKGRSLVAGLSHISPGLRISYGKNLWRYLEKVKLGKWYKVKGIGGQTISSSVENYMNFGYWGVILLGVFFGMVYGSIFEWQRRYPENRILIMFAVGAVLIFLVAIYKKMAIRTAYIPMTLLLPLGFLASYACTKKTLYIFLGLLTFLFMLLVVYKFTSFAMLSYMMAVFLIIMYIYSLFSIGKSTLFD